MARFLKSGLRAFGCIVVFLTAIAPLAAAEVAEVIVAVAANFTSPAEKIAKVFEAETGHDVSLSFAATGTLFAQISQGAPFDVFLAADRARAKASIENGTGVADTLFTYAVGRLALYAPRGHAGEQRLRAGDFSHLAIADPESAPYGAAALQTLAALGLSEALADKIVTGANVTQALQFIQTGNAEMGFVALSQVADVPGEQKWLVPERLHAPIEQGAVLLAHGANNEAARAFWRFLQGPQAQAIIVEAGYAVPAPLEYFRDSDLSENALAQ